jgi:N-acetylneuraminate synthase
MDSVIDFRKLEHTFVIAEAGSNWKAGAYDEDLERAKQMISVAAEAGADAVKFQTFRAETVYVPNAGKSKYLSESRINQDIYQLFEQISMPYKMLEELSEYCNKNNLLFMSSPFSVIDAQQVDKYVLLHKVASFEINHIRMLEFFASTKKPIIISTGASTYDEIDFAVNLFLKNNCKNLALLQCTSKYPCPLSALNISVIPKLAERYNLPVGLSDHSTDPIIAPLIAIGMGAKIIEKHFTLDKNLPGPDHSFALNPKELCIMIASIREAEKTKGDGHKHVLDEELELRKFAVRSIQAIKDIKKGEILVEGKNIGVLRPGNQSRGTEPRFLEKVVGKKASRDIQLGEGILGNFE